MCFSSSPGMKSSPWLPVDRPSASRYGSSIEAVLEYARLQEVVAKYDELFADGIYDIAIHFGGDYNEERYDIETAKWALKRLGAE